MAKLQELSLNRSGSRALLLIAIIAGLVAAVLVFMALRDSDDSAPVVAPPDTVQAIVAAQNIAPGTEITEGMLRVVDVPENLLVAGAFSTSTPLVGEVTNVAVAEGEQITRGKIGPLVEAEGISYVIPRGLRAVGVEVAEVTAVGGLLLPGDRVDVIAVYVDEERVAHSRMIVQDVEVLSVAQTALEAVGVAEDGNEAIDLPTSGRLPDDVEEEPGARTLTLAVTPEQAVILAGLQDDPHVARVWAAARRAGEEPADVPGTVIVPGLFAE